MEVLQELVNTIARSLKATQMMTLQAIHTSILLLKKVVQEFRTLTYLPTHTRTINNTNSIRIRLVITLYKISHHKTNNFYPKDLISNPICMLLLTATRASIKAHRNTLNSLLTSLVSFLSNWPCAVILLKILFLAKTTIAKKSSTRQNTKLFRRYFMKENT